jgi:glycerol-3-phosphate acyltransferase PlsX
MSVAVLRMGRIEGVKRPGIATSIPVPGFTPTVLIDAGANTRCQPEWLVQFAQMGSVFARQRHGLADPRVGLLSNGEEAVKGTALVREAHAMLRSAPGVNFLGNVEGRDVMSDDVDVVVADGFTGNVVLKTLEGGTRFVCQAVIRALSATEELRGAFDVAWPTLQSLVSELDPDTQGGAVLLGVNGVCIVCHGSSSPAAIVGAVRMAEEMVAADLVGHLARAVGAGTGGR